MVRSLFRLRWARQARARLVGSLHAALAWVLPVAPALRPVPVRATRVRRPNLRNAS